MAQGDGRDVDPETDVSEMRAELEELRRDVAVTREFGRLGERLLAPLGLREKLQLITDSVVELLGADFARIWMVREGDLCARGCRHAAATDGPHLCRDRSCCLHLMASSGRYTGLDGDHRRVPLGSYKIGRIASGEDASFCTNDVENDPRVHDHEWARALGLRSFAGHRLIDGSGQPVGVLALFSQRSLCGADARMVAGVARHSSYVVVAGAAAEAQRRSEDHLQRLWTNMAEAVAMYELVRGDAGEVVDYRVVDVNPAFERIIGLRRDAVIGQRAMAAFRFAELPYLDLFKRVALEGATERFEAHFAHVKRDFEVSAAPWGEEGFATIFTDITERKRLEERLRQADKLTAIGQLAGGVAHDFNNQLTGILGYADLLVALLADDELRGYARQIVTSAQRAADLTQKLLAFGRKGKFLSVPVDVHQLLGEVVAILDRSIDKRIRLVQTFAAERTMVRGDPSQLQNAFLNVALNARDAMPQGGELTFETSVVDFDDDFCRTSPYEVAPGPFVRVSVTDTGCGMTGEVKKHLFEPFFTTKKLGEGTGMGLASVYGTVRNHRGTISVYSEEGHGTTVRICLPLSDDATDRPTTAPAEEAHAVAAGRILVADDEPAVRETAAAMLRRDGHHVVACAEGREAVDHYRANWQEIDLVILDMVMPVMGGRDAFLAMRAINPDVVALLSSGYALNGEAQAILDDGVRAFIGKPYRYAELSQLVAETLAKR